MCLVVIFEYKYNAICRLLDIHPEIGAIITINWDR